MKSRGGKSQRRGEKKKEDQGRERVRRLKMQVREKVAKSWNTVFFHVFPMICGSGGSKVGSQRRRVRSHLARWEMKNCMRLWREAHFEVKMYKTHQLRTFGSCDVEKAHAVLARRTPRSQNVQNAPGPDHFWKLRCRKSARRCGAKHISKSKCTKHTSSGLLAVAMSKKCTPFWREEHPEVKMYKTHQVRTTFGSWDVEKSARRCGAKHISKSEVQKTEGAQSTFGRSDVVVRGRRRGLRTLSKVSKTWGFVWQFQLQPLHSTTLHYITLHYTTLHDITLHHTTTTATTATSTLHYTKVH